jgi:hypothetical protein
VRAGILQLQLGLRQGARGAVTLPDSLQIHHNIGGAGRRHVAHHRRHLQLFQHHLLPATSCGSMTPLFFYGGRWVGGCRRSVGAQPSGDKISIATTASGVGRLGRVDMLHI